MPFPKEAIMERNRSHDHIRATRVPQMVDLLDRILDKGMVIDAWGGAYLFGVDFGMRWEARMVVASIGTYLKHAGPIGLLESVAWRCVRRNLALDPGCLAEGLVSYGRARVPRVP